MAGLSEILEESCDELRFEDGWPSEGAPKTQSESSEYELAGADQFVF